MDTSTELGRTVGHQDSDITEVCKKEIVREVALNAHGSRSIDTFEIDHVVLGRIITRSSRRYIK